MNINWAMSIVHERWSTKVKLFLLQVSSSKFNVDNKKEDLILKLTCVLFNLDAMFQFQILILFLSLFDIENSTLIILKLAIFPWFLSINVLLCRLLQNKTNSIAKIFEYISFMFRMDLKSFLKILQLFFPRKVSC